jgi:hypothetical protein
LSREVADKLWEMAKLNSKDKGLCESLLDDVIHPVIAVQQAGANALATLLEQSQPAVTESILQLLLDIYIEKNNVSSLFFD